MNTITWICMTITDVLELYMIVRLLFKMRKLEKELDVMKEKQEP